MPRTGGPYLVHAAICEKVLQEPDGVLSLIRVIDRVTVNLQTTAFSGVEAPVPPEPPPIVLTFAVSFKSGDFRGSLPVKIHVDTPHGLRWPDFQVSALFEGDDRGVNVVLPMQFPMQSEGVYWFVVELGGDLMTRVPFRVIKQTAAQNFPPQLG